MSQAKSAEATPGPWRVSSLQEWYIISGDDPVPICALAEFSSDGTVEHVFPDNNKRQARANACLIVEAVNAYRSSPDAQAPSGWISVTEKLPKSGQQVLISAIRENGERMMEISHQFPGLLASWYVEKDQGFSKQPTVTHWQPLPDPPTEVTK